MARRLVSLKSRKLVSRGEDAIGGKLQRRYESAVTNGLEDFKRVEMTEHA